MAVIRYRVVTIEQPTIYGLAAGLEGIRGRVVFVESGPSAKDGTHIYQVIIDTWNPPREAE